VLCVHISGGFGKFTNLVDLESSQIWWIWKANIETCRSRDDVAAFVTLGRRLDDQGLYDLQANAVMELKPHMKRSSLQKTWMKNELDEPAPVDLYTISNLPNTLKKFEGGIALLQNLDANCKCVLLMGRDVYFAVAPFNVMLDENSKKP